MFDKARILYGIIVDVASYPAYFVKMNRKNILLSVMHQYPVCLHKQNRTS